MLRLPSLVLPQRISLPVGWRGKSRALGVAFAVTLAVRFWLTVSSLPSTRSRFLPRFSESVALDLREVARIAWAIDTVSRIIPGATCLTQAQAGQILLARRGWASTLYLGLQESAPGEIRAHAWLRCANKIVLGGDSATVAAFRPIAQLGPWA